MTIYKNPTDIITNKIKQVIYAKKCQHKILIIIVFVLNNRAGLP